MCPWMIAFLWTLYHNPGWTRAFPGFFIPAAAPHNAAMNIRLFLGWRSPPRPSQGPGPGCAGLRPAPAEVWGNPVSPHPSSRAYVHVSHPYPCGAAPPHTEGIEKTFLLERAAPAQTLPPPPQPSPAGGGNPAPPPSGGRLGGGLQRRMRVGEQPMFTLVRAPGRGDGETGFSLAQVTRMATRVISSWGGMPSAKACTSASTRSTSWPAGRWPQRWMIRSRRSKPKRLRRWSWASTMPSV